MRSANDTSRRLLLALAIAFWCDCGAAETNEGSTNMEIDAQLPGGNVIVEKIEGDTVFLHQDLRDTAGDWFYWCFRVRGAAGRTVTFSFTHGDVSGTRGPACSTDGGKTWTWLGLPKAENAGAPAKKPPAFQYTFAADAGEVRFCFGIPYFESDLKDFLAKHHGRPELKAETLCKTKKDRAVEVLFFGPPAGKGEYRLVFTCRHHSCESMASYELEGILEALLADDQTGQWYREHVSAVIVPFVDKDGVEDGDQGKNRKPHDHNRDYAGEPIYPAVAALKKLLAEWSGGRLDLAVDLHCPWRLDNVIQFIGGPDPKMWERVGELSRMLEETKQGPLPFSAKDNLPFGKNWNTDTAPQKGFARWAGELPGTRIATTIEFPYATAKGVEITPQNARLFGRGLAEAMRAYMEKNP